MPTISYTLTRDDEDIDIEVEFEVAPYYAACTYGPPEHCSPAEGGEVEEMTAYRDGEPIELTAEEEAKIEQFIYDHHDYEDDGE